MHPIEIDFEVFKALTARRENERMTYNDVIRDLLGLNQRSRPESKSAPTAGPQSETWICKGVPFAVGTEFRSRYKDVVHYAKVVSAGILVNGQTVTSPSDAAKVITGNSVNGWLFWECRFPGDSRWRLIKSLRKPNTVRALHDDEF